MPENGWYLLPFAFLILVFYSGSSEGYTLCIDQHSPNCNNSKQEVFNSVFFIWNKASLNASSASLVLEGIILCMIFLFSLLGNGVLASTVVIEERFRTPTNLLVIGQCFVDLGLGLSVVLLALVVVLQGGWMLKPHWCVAQTFFNRLFLSLSFLNFALLALDRYIVIVKTKHWNRFSKNQIISFSVCIWIVGISTSIPWDFLFFPSEVWYEITSSFCLIRYKIPVKQMSSLLVILRSIIYMIIPTLIVILCFYRILGIVRMSRRKVGPSTVSNWRKIAVAVHAKSAYTSIAVLTSFAVCILPFLLVIGLTMIGKPVSYASAAAAKCMYYANTGMKPLIYISRNVLWSRRLKQFITRRRKVQKVVTLSPVIQRAATYKLTDNERRSDVPELNAPRRKKLTSKGFHELFSVSGSVQAWDTEKRF